LFITGASRGIGKAIALRAARDGANIVIAAKTAVEDRRLPGTIHSAASDIEAAGGRALALQVDIRHEQEVQAAVARAVEHFGGIDILVNNASAISLTDTPGTTLKRYDLMMDVNVRGTFVCTQACLVHLRKASNPHVLVLSPPIVMEDRWLAPHAAYTVSKYAMSMMARGLAAELRPAGIAVNTLWPRTLIDTAALNIASPGDRSRARKPEIMADAAWHVLTSDSRQLTGRHCIDEEILRAAGCSDFDRYSVTPGAAPALDIYID
jgi:citronellol/citronellal dehydrogenase